MRIKNLVSLPSKLFRNRTLINKENLLKVFNYAKNGELLRAFERISQKIAAFEKANKDRNVTYLNGCLMSVNVCSLDVVVDIIIPIYNAYEYTAKCIDSVYKNTDTDYNLYLINDCSTDDRIKILLEDLRHNEKPGKLKKLLILENTENMGFIRTVNKGMSLSENHIVLLNTDTEVPYGWLRRLVFPIINDARVASVTPFSNSANICSFPEIVVDNELPKRMSVQDVDNIFRKHGGDALIDIPTGVGFCMAMNRKCISSVGVFDVVYGKGYGEENDWCCRAKEQGYRNVLITNLYVYHKHGVSFGKLFNKSKEKRIAENLKILSDRYPKYLPSVDKFVACDPIKDLRRFLWVIIKRNFYSSTESVLILNHSLGGGATSYVERKIGAESIHKDFVLMELLPDFISLKLTLYLLGEKSEVYFNFKQLDSYFIKKLTECLNINHIFINHLLGYPLEIIFDMIKKAGLPYTFFIHDFYCVCPRYNLCNENYVYCNGEKDVATCNKCLSHHSGCENIAEWRNLFRSLLLEADAVIAPSQNTSNIIGGYYDDVAITVIEHDIPTHIRKTYSKDFIGNKVFNISVLGAIGIEKGSKILYELVNEIRKRKLPIKITVIGYTDLHGEKYVSKNRMFEVTGRYDNKSVSTLLSDYRTNLVMIPSICPETYSYTVSEAIYSGYKVIAFDLGAPADRIRSMKMGWLVNEISSTAMLGKIIEIMEDVGCAGHNSNGG